MTSDTYLPDIGGAEVHVYELQKRLRGLGHEIVLIVTSPHGSEEDVSYPVERCAWSWKHAHFLLVRIARVSKSSDIYHSHYCHKLAVLTGFVARVRRKPFIITLHGLGILDHPGTPWLYDKMHRLYRWTSLRLATHIISTSEDLAFVCERYRARKDITVIPNGLDTSRFDPAHVVLASDRQMSDAHPVIMSVRRLVPKNGIHYLVMAMPYIIKKYPHAKLVMIGDGRLRGEIEARVARLGLQKQCVFLGAQPNDRIAGLAIQADIVAFPSTAESTSIACAEMMALERRIVASRVGGLVELLGTHEERGWLVKLVDWEHSDYGAPMDLPEERYRALADRILVAYEDKQGEQKTHAARAYAVAELDWKRIVERTVACYERFAK